MEQPNEIVPVTPEEARFTVRFACTSELLKDWQRHPVRTNRKVLQALVWIVGGWAIAKGLWQMAEGLYHFVRSMGVRLVWAWFTQFDVIFPLTYIGLGVLVFSLGRIRMRKNIRQMTAMFGPEPWPVEYRFGEDRFTATQCGTVQTMMYSRINWVWETADFVLLTIGENVFRIPKYAFAQGTPQELVTFLRTKVPAKR